MSGRRLSWGQVNRWSRVYGKSRRRGEPEPSGCGFWLFVIIFIVLVRACGHPRPDPVQYPDHFCTCSDGRMNLTMAPMSDAECKGWCDRK